MNNVACIAWLPYWVTYIDRKRFLALSTAVWNVCERSYSIARPEPEQEPAKFIIHPWLENDETETEFLRTVADVLLIHLLPDDYAKVQSVRHLLREILACAGAVLACSRCCCSLTRAFITCCSMMRLFSICCSSLVRSFITCCSMMLSFIILVARWCARSSLVASYALVQTFWHCWICGKSRSQGHCIALFSDQTNHWPLVRPGRHQRDAV